MEPNKNDWEAWSNHVLIELKDHKEAIKDIRENRLPNISGDLAMLKVKASIWGAIAGMIPVAIAVIVKVLK